MIPRKIVERAFLLALKYHEGQLRKDGKPYVVHPVMVGSILLQNGFPDEVVAAGICHDLLEDTPCSEDEIKNECGEKVLEIVMQVSDDKDLQSRQLWEKRKEAQIEKVRKASDEVKAVYIADKIHNLGSLLEQYQVEGEEVWQHFARGLDVKLKFEREILKMLRETWNHPLIDYYEKLIKKEEELSN